MDYPPISKDIIDLPDSMFASADWRVISREGENYYKACGEVVHDFKEGGFSTCIKPLYHKTWTHEDFDGRLKDRDFGPSVDMDWQTRDFVGKLLLRTGLDDEQIFNVLNSLLYGHIKLVRE